MKLEIGSNLLRAIFILLFAFAFFSLFVFKGADVVVTIQHKYKTLDHADSLRIAIDFLETAPNYPALPDTSM